MHIFYHKEILHNFEHGNMLHAHINLYILTYLTVLVHFLAPYALRVLYFYFLLLNVKNIYIYFLTASLQNSGNVISFFWYYYSVIFYIFLPRFSTPCHNCRILHFSFLHPQKYVFLSFLNIFSEIEAKHPAQAGGQGAVLSVH